MSREFGRYNTGGYFFDLINTCAEDASESERVITQLWGKVLTEFAPVAYDIASFEAGDSGLAEPVISSITAIPRIKDALRKLDEYLEPYKRVAQLAIASRATEESPFGE